MLVVAGVIAAGLYYRSHQTKPLTEKDTIVIADFDNQTGDAVFDDTLKTALTVALNQSPFLNVLSDNKVAATLKLMTRPVNTKLTPDVARELCLRAGSQAYIAGSIANLGNEYVLGLKAVNCQSGEPLAQEQVTAEGKEKVLNALGDAAAKLRGQLGESLATVQRFDVPLAAGHYFFAGSAAGLQHGNEDRPGEGHRCGTGLRAARHSARSEFCHGISSGGQQLREPGRVRARQRVLHQSLRVARTRQRAGEAGHHGVVFPECYRGAGQGSTDVSATD